MSQPHPPPSPAPTPAPAAPTAEPEPVQTGVRSESPEREVPATSDVRQPSPEREVPAASDVRQPSPSGERIAFAEDSGSGGSARQRTMSYGPGRPGASRANSRRRRSISSISELHRADIMRRQSTYATAQPYPSFDRPLPPRPDDGLIDYVVPSFSEKNRRTISYRLQPTVDAAETECKNCARKAQLTGYALNVAIGLQVLLGSLTTGVSAVASQGNIGVSTVILGALSTLVASYLARARGSNEPELSITRTKDLEQFLRECKTFLLDHGHKYGLDGIEGSEEEQHEKQELESRLEGFRGRFEELLGNANGERKLSPVSAV